MAVVSRVAALPARVSASLSRSAALGDCGGATEGGDSTVTRVARPELARPELRGADRDDDDGAAATAVCVCVSS